MDLWPLLITRYQLVTGTMLNHKQSVDIWPLLIDMHQLVTGTMLNRRHSKDLTYGHCSFDMYQLVTGTCWITNICIPRMINIPLIFIVRQNIAPSLCCLLFFHMKLCGRNEARHIDEVHPEQWKFNIFFN